ncbi:hypothetical protein [Erythrobacter sp. WG]|uniref:hypothetical protein n=1 Tax=Erythrobacter sp. WG TaxID=2985510 RepID=UPI00226D8505|nr:hypothetical protein [Erythrobacter sp. WG]MCX9148485.1 hypothetical protein [Erythrobacter sp. WG]
MSRVPLALAGLALASGLLAGCKPPPTDSAVARVSLEMPDKGPSEPIASPDVTGAGWTRTANPQRLVYGKPGEPVMLALECLAPGTPEAMLRITRHAPADEGAAALLALIGNGWIGRFPVDAIAVGGQSLWQGDILAAQPQWEALKPEREATVTVPGAGLLRLNPSPLPIALITACRGSAVPATPALADPGDGAEEPLPVR